MPTSGTHTISSIPARGRRKVSAVPPGEAAATAPASSNVTEVLAQLDAELKRVGDEDPQRKAALEAERERVAGEATPPEPEETELERLRRRDREASERETAKSIAGEIVQRYQAGETERQQRIEAIAREEVTKMLGAHGGSRFVGSGADEAAAKHVAAGGALVPGTGQPAGQWGQPEIPTKTVVPARSALVGEHNEVQKLRESKSFARFFGAVQRFSKGMASDAEREFLMSTKALAEGTDSAGGFVIPPDWMPDVLNLLRGVAVVRRAKPRIVPFGKQMNQVSLSSGATAYYTAENAAIPTSQEAFAQVTLLTPKNLTGLVPVSDYLLRDSIGSDDIDENAEDIIRTDLATVLGLREDLSFLQGAGTSGEPLGLKNIGLGTSGANIDPIAPGTNGFTPTLPQLRQIRNFTRKLNVPNPRWVWFFHSSFISYVEQLTDSLGRFLADTSLLQITDVSDPAVSYSAGVQGTLDGVPFFASNQIPINLTQGSASNATYLLLVNMNELVVGINREMSVDVSNDASYTPDGGTTWISAFQNNQTLFRSVLRHDINHRYPTQVIIQRGVLV